MNQRTLTALRASIEHWERNAAATDPRKVRMGTQACALCAEFYDQSDMCKGCPIYTATGRDGCRNTPYGEASSYIRDAEFCRRTFSPEMTAEAMASFRTAARAEVRFLSSLLPQDEGATA